MSTSDKKKYWIEYTNGERKVFEAKDSKAAHHYFMMEGDHAYAYGIANKDYFHKRLKGE